VSQDDHYTTVAAAALVLVKINWFTVTSICIVKAQLLPQPEKTVDVPDLLLLP
jgi:hypothetical protein